MLDNKAYLYYFKNDIDIKINVTPNILNHFNNFRNEKKRIVKLKKYTLLDIALKEFGYSIADIYFENGKPLINGIHISTSDSNSYFGFVISNNNIGLDIEDEIDSKKKQAINKFLANAKFDYLVDDVIKWMMVEAYSKYLGTGLSESVLNSSYNISSYYINKIENTYFTVYKNKSEEVVLKELIWE